MCKKEIYSDFDGVVAQYGGRKGVDVLSDCKHEKEWKQIERGLMGKSRPFETTVCCGECGQKLSLERRKQ